MTGRPAPGLRYRSIWDQATDPARTPAQVYTWIQGLPDDDSALRNHTRNRALTALASRPDLDPDTLDRLVSGAQGAEAYLLRLLQNEHLPLAQRQAWVGSTLVPFLIGAPGFEKSVVALLGHHPDMSRDNLREDLLARARAALTPAQIRTALDALLHGTPDEQALAAESPFLDGPGWDRLIARVAARDQVALRLVPTLTRRIDITEQRALALLRAIKGHDHEIWFANSLASNPHLPEPVWARLVTHRLKSVRMHAHTSEKCPDSARFHAVRRGHVGALLGVDSTVPADVGHLVLDAVASGEPIYRALGQVDEDALVKLLASRSDDPEVLDRVVRYYLTRHDARTGAARFFQDAMGARRSPWGWQVEEFDAQDALLTFMAAHPLGEVRAFVVSHLDDAGYREAATDPSPVVRATVAADPRLVRHQDLLIALADDPDPAVRAAAGEQFLGALNADLTT